LRWAIHRKIRPEYVTFDNWYASKKNMQLVAKELKLEFATRLKKNTRLRWEGRRLQARTTGANARAYHAESDTEGLPASALIAGPGRGGVDRGCAHLSAACPCCSLRGPRTRTDSRGTCPSFPPSHCWS
jgi:hypothetical protein